MRFSLALDVKRAVTLNSMPEFGRNVRKRDCTMVVFGMQKRVSSGKREDGNREEVESGDDRDGGGREMKESRDGTSYSRRESRVGGEQEWEEAEIIAR